MLLNGFVLTRLYHTTTSICWLSCVLIGYFHYNTSTRVSYHCIIYIYGEGMPIGPCDTMWFSLRDHVRQNLPPFSDKWWSPIISMAAYKPLISLHLSEVSTAISCDVIWIALQLLALCGYHDNSYWEWFVTNPPKGPYQGLICHATFLIMCKNKVKLDMTKNSIVYAFKVLRQKSS